jgi:hypothetical protein
MDVPINPASIPAHAVAEIDADLAAIRSGSIKSRLSEILQRIHRKIPALLVGDDVLKEMVLARAELQGLHLCPDASALAFFSQWLERNLPDTDGPYWVKDLADQCRRDALAKGIQFAELEADLDMPLEEALMNAIDNHRETRGSNPNCRSSP